MSDISVFSVNLASARKAAGVSSETLAKAAGVSKQAVRKWETGECMPAFSKLPLIAEALGVTIDSLVSDKAAKPAPADVKPEICHQSIGWWESYMKALGQEYRQCFDEGKDIEPLRELLESIAMLPDDSFKDELADALFRKINTLPQREDYPYFEPSDLPGILDECDCEQYDYPAQSKMVLRDRIKGAWYGRICGCLLGKPVEGFKYDALTAMLKDAGNYPLSRYITSKDREAVKDHGELSIPWLNINVPEGPLAGMPVDDDTNYIILALLVLKSFGRDFTPANVSGIWLQKQQKGAYCTAERVAYRNFVAGYLPPDSAIYKNPFREWIGAQIRGDFYGWINPGAPATAAEFAWRDASISHVKNGIYGEMWASAMLGAAGGGAPIKDAVRIGLSYVPKRSRLHKAVSDIIAAYESGKTFENFSSDFHRRWDDNDGNDWCHTVSNAEIVAASLLWGEGDYGKSICLAVGEGFDTDCNGATVGSVVGIANGFSALPAEWTDKVSGTLFTSIFGYEKNSISKMADETMRFMK